MNQIAVCAGSFDPITMGHVNIIERSLAIFDRVIVAIAVNTSKNPVFTIQERLTLLKELFAKHSAVEVEAFEGLLVNYCKSKKATAMLRGIRNMSDYEYECQIAMANKSLAPDIETLFLMSSPQYSHLSSSLVKEILTFGGSAHDMLPSLVEKEMKRKLRP